MPSWVVSIKVVIILNFSYVSYMLPYITYVMLVWKEKRRQIKQNKRSNVWKFIFSALYGLSLNLNIWIMANIVVTHLSRIHVYAFYFYGSYSLLFTRLFIVYCINTCVFDILKWHQSINKTDFKAIWICNINAQWVKQ